MDGATVSTPEQCGECGVKPVKEDVESIVKQWSELAETCSFCGKPIALVSGPLVHLHTKQEGVVWTIQEPEWEPSFECYRIGTFGGVDVRAHQSCARSGTPYFRWDGDVTVPKGIPEGVQMPIVTALSPCDECGEVATQKEIEIVIGRLYELSYGSICAYCGDVIRLEKVTVGHKTLDGRHIGRWHFQDWRWAPFFDWTVYRPGKLGEVRGTLSVAVKRCPTLGGRVRNPWRGYEKVSGKIHRIGIL